MSSRIECVAVLPVHYRVTVVQRGGLKAAGPSELLCYAVISATRQAKPPISPIYTPKVSVAGRLQKGGNTSLECAIIMAT